MKNAPFLLSTILALVAVILSIVSLTSAQSNNGMQSSFLKKQTELQDLTQDVTLKNQEAQRQVEVINSWNNVGEKVAKPILIEMGYRAAKNKNAKFKAILEEQKFQDAIPTAEKLKEIDKMIEQNKPKTAPASPAPAVAPAAPALRP